MGWRFGRGPVAALCVGLAGCAVGGGRLANTEPAKLIALLQTGQPALDCRDTCLDAWRAAQPRAAQLEASGQWSDLAVLVMRTGYQDDLSLYYLGRAAEGLRYYPAAASYYRQSLQISPTANSCDRMSRQCGGVTLPRAASQRLTAIDRLVSPSRRPARPAPSPAIPAAAGEPPAGVPAAIPVGEPSGLPADIVPGAAVDPPAPAVAPAPARRAPAGHTDYIEPPPAAR